MLVKVNVIKLKGILTENKISYSQFAENAGVGVFRMRAIMRGSMQPKINELDEIVKCLGNQVNLKREDLCIWSDGKNITPD